MREYICIRGLKIARDLNFAIKVKDKADWFGIKTGEPGGMIGAKNRESSILVE